MTRPKLNLRLFDMSADFYPWRRQVEFVPYERAVIQPLIEALDFIKDKRGWGYPFRRRLFEISAEDFERIAGAMKVKRD